jgi:hypothetical protein
LYRSALCRFRASVSDLGRPRSGDPTALTRGQWGASAREKRGLIYKGRLCAARRGRHAIDHPSESNEIDVSEGVATCAIHASLTFQTSDTT